MYMIETKMLPIRCACQSLIGVGSHRPVSWGNYFWLYDDESGSIRILNMWWENLKSLTRAHNSFLAAPIQNGVVEVRIYTDQKLKRKWGIVTDKRVPPEYLYNKLCYTGYLMPTEEIAKSIYDLLGDPENEFEQYTDPVSYYKKRGAKYDPEKGIITWFPKSQTRELEGITIEQQEDLIVEHSDLDAIEELEKILKEEDNDATN